MVVINLAYTAPINPAGEPIVLTEDQVWAGLKRKVRRAYEFVPVITDCKVISEDGDITVREATFQGVEKPVRETCVHMAPSRIDFRQEDGSNVSNIVSKNAEGGLMMTYAFELRHPQIEAGSEEDIKKREHYNKMSKMAVEGSITTIRRLVQEGQL
ncbi:hypothetical protein S40293_06334 [Stachybotrys chartarum IBT 40293]|nr:hypothetical protein S40293_06334 [Stachybotrys chartarum IBT 40293]KFA75337.1 hypothetical protein S40288_01989 [Stachybotrys chartarum IBT 40288]